MNTTRTIFGACAVVVTACAVGTASGQNTVDPTLFNFFANTGVDDPAGLTNQINVSSRIFGSDNPEDAFGNNDGAVEGNSFLFGDGNPVGTNNTIEWITSSAVTITGLRFQGGAAGPDAGDPRRIMQLAFIADQNNNGILLNQFGAPDDPILFNDPNFGDTGDGGTGDITYTFAAVTANRFGLLVQNQDGGGARIGEVDAVIPEPGSMLLCGLSAVVLGLRRRRA